MNNEQKAKIESGFLTTLTMAMILLLLWYVSIDAPRETEEDDSVRRQRERRRC